ncbi:MAG: DUF3179 domain-containing (seleno)protein [Pseudomonadota bacterium]
MLAALICALGSLAYQGAAQASDALPQHVIERFGAPPAAPTGALPDDIEASVLGLVSHTINQSDWDPSQTSHFDTLAASKDPRLVWLIADMMKFTWRPEFFRALRELAVSLIAIELKTLRQRDEIINRIIAWDLPAYPGYLAHKRRIFTNYVPGWENILVDGNIDWHLVTWGGVNIDTRPFDQTDTVCDCIPAADNPEVSGASKATWLEDDDIVFGIEVNGAYRAYPLQIMEVREMVNDTLGGRDLAIPYCSLCGAAQAYFTDNMPDGVDRPILRTSGLLIRSNKIMFDLNTYSVFDTFRGVAVTGPLADKNVRLPRVTVTTSDWGSWRQAYPETTVLVEALALGRDYNLRETRDANGPIFPIGDVDPRLPEHEDIVGVVSASGKAVAFQRSKAMAALKSGQDVEREGVRLTLDAGGVRAMGKDGSDLGSHQAFWFAWSQFYPGTALWP